MNQKAKKGWEQIRNQDIKELFGNLNNLQSFQNNRFWNGVFMARTDLHFPRTGVHFGAIIKIPFVRMFLWDLFIWPKGPKVPLELKNSAQSPKSPRETWQKFIFFIFPQKIRELPLMGLSLDNPDQELFKNDFNIIKS